MPPGFRIRRYSSIRDCCIPPIPAVFGVTILASLIIIKLNSSSRKGSGIFRRSCCTNRQFMSSSVSILGARGAISTPVKDMDETPRWEKCRWHITLQNPVPQAISRTRFGGLLSKAGEHTGPPKTWQSNIVRRVCRCISWRSHGKG